MEASAAIPAMCARRFRRQNLSRPIPQETTAPNHVNKREVDQNQPRRQEQHVGLKVIRLVNAP